MRFQRYTKRLSMAAAAAALVGLSAFGVSSPTAAADTARGPTGQNASSGGDSAAGNYHWGQIGWSKEFNGTQLDSDWAVYDGPGNGGNGTRNPAQVSVANGVMTQSGTADANTAGMVLNDHFAPYGRWETRLRTPQTGQGGNAYHPVTALIPGGDAPYHCGATDIDYAEYDIGAPQNIFIHNLPSLQDYTSVTVDPTQWHNYAVEVAADHISWFVDGNVVMTDTDKAAISGVPLALNFQLDANYPGNLNPATLQVDWSRYYPLPANTAPVPAPAPNKGTYNGAC